MFKILFSLISVRYNFKSKCVEGFNRVSQVKGSVNYWNLWLISLNRTCACGQQLQSSNMAASSNVPQNLNCDDGAAEIQSAPTADSNANGSKRKSESKAKGPKTKKVKLKNSERPGYGEDRFDETEYYFENGLRKVRPYFFTFSTYCKGRWTNKKLIDVYSNEFRAQPKEEFERNIREGQILVNHKAVPLEYVLRNGDYISNKTHRHELPVVDKPIKIVHQSEDLLVVDKPASIPVHPCGRYRHNTMIFILGKEYGFKDIRNAHRIDRLTSGLLIFARNLERDRELKTQISSRLVEKEYLCRVEGEFPSEPLVCVQPIAIVSYKIGVCRVCPDSKECMTTFTKLGYNGKSSVVLCKPHTGRMHQIRVHLQYLGFPIVNDPLYNDLVFGPNKGKNGDIGKSDHQLIEDLVKIHTAEAWLGESKYGGKCDSEIGAAPFSASTVTITDVEEIVQGVTNAECGNGESPSRDEIRSDSKSQSYDPHCPECNGSVKFRDPKPEDQMMYLHAWKYKGPGWEFQTDIPDWAKEDWTKD